ncbi:MAG: serine/threonine-protein kinase, partial [Planctomycetota bacterium]|nr:serine/threonine-protein kinase [Planctomycetota bacterium]
MPDGPAQNGCPPLEDIERAVRGESDEYTKVHVRLCPRCAAQYERIAEDNALLAELAGAVADRAAPSVAAGIDLIPGYELLDEIHRGGQGVVFRARQTATHREVAVKMLLQGAFATSEQRKRFEREVELAARLRHPGLVTIFESGRATDGRLYVAMQLVNGETLDLWLSRPERRVVEQGRLAIDRILALFARIAEAVAYAHQRGVIHRDLKPANIIVDDEGNPVILDFGIARAEGDNDLATTRTGEFIGTFLYAAPEQIAGSSDHIDTRIDVYALGVMLYEALCKRRPHAFAGSFAETIRSITETDPAPPSSLVRIIDRDAETITLTALARDPDRRYQSAGAFAEDLRRRLEGQPIQARRDDTWYVVRKALARLRGPVIAAAAFLILIIASSIVASVLLVRTNAALRESLDVSRAIISSLLPIDTETSTDRVNSVTDFVDRISDAVETRLAPYPETLGEVRATLAAAYIGEQQFEKAEEQALGAIALLEQSEEDDAAITLAHAWHNLGRVRWRRSDYVGAELAYRNALDLRIENLGREHLDTARTMHHLGATL